MHVNKYYTHHSRYPANSEQPFHKVTHRHDRTIPGMVPAQDVWTFNEDPARDPDRLYMTIKNPSKPYRTAY
jgi:hypothetical protein